MVFASSCVGLFERIGAGVSIKYALDEIKIITNSEIKFLDGILNLRYL